MNSDAPISTDTSRFLTIPRSLFSHWLWTDDTPRTRSRAEAYLDLLQLAADESTRKFVNGKLITLEPGEMVASERFLAERWDWSRTKVRTFLNLLKKDYLMTQGKSMGETIIRLNPESHQ